MTKQQSYTGPRPDVISMIRKVPTRVLDVGCSNGNLGKALKSKYTDILVFGIDNHDINLSEAEKKIDKTYKINLDNLSFEDIPNEIDLLICADVLEHTKEPLKVLRELLKKCTNDAEVVISLPNIQHISAILTLVNGSWPERDRGTFDKTHLRFFTLKSIKKLVYASDLKIINLSRNYRLFDAPGGYINLFVRKTFRFLPFFKNFFAYQYVFTAERILKN